MKITFLKAAVIGLVGIGLTAGTAAGYTLSNTAVTTSDYGVLFNDVWIANGMPGSISGTFDFDDDGVADGALYSGVDSGTINNQTVYAYFYSVDVFASSSHGVSAFSFDWGLKAPLTADLTNDSTVNPGDSFWGTGSWNATYTNDGNAPFGATYDPNTGTINVSYFSQNIMPGDKSSWFFVLSLDQPNQVPFNVTNSGAGESVGVIYSPVPEPASMLLFGTGLIGLAGIARRRKTMKK